MSLNKIKDDIKGIKAKVNDCIKLDDKNYVIYKIEKDQFIPMNAAAEKMFISNYPAFDKKEQLKILEGEGYVP